MTYKITLLPGDGIGPEITEAVKEMLKALDVDIEWEELSCGEKAYRETGSLIPDSVYKSIEKNKVCLKGPVTTPIGKGFRSVNVQLRKKYDLYCNLRPVKRIGKIPSKFEDVNLVLFRENTEDLYMGIEEKISDEEMHSIKVITKEGSTRIVEAAFQYADKNGYDKVTVVTKANIMKLTDGLFLDCAREVAKKYPSIELNEMLIDAICMKLVMDPSQYGVIVTENLYGDILSDLMAGLIGGLGLVPGANLGKDIAIFEAVHGSAPDIAGKNLANPTALAQSASMMLEYLGEGKRAKILTRALDRTLSDPDNFTRDLGGELTTSDFTKKVIEEIR